MSRVPRRKTVSVVVVGLLVAALAAFAGGGQSAVTNTRLERDLSATFANTDLRQAAILGHRGLSRRSLHPTASCDRGGPRVSDVGPGSDWICLIAWSDPNTPLPDGTAKFELNVHADGCFTAGGPSKVIGPQTIIGPDRKDVSNPLFEFDSCLDPRSSNVPTGVTFDKPVSSLLTPTQQAASSAVLTLPSGTMAADMDGKIAPTLSCSPGKDGCAGTLAATITGRTITTTFAIAADDRRPLPLPLPRGTTGTVALKATPVVGTVFDPTSTITLIEGP